MDTSSDLSAVADVPLFLADPARSVDNAPNDIAIGLILLRGWQLHRLSPLPPDFSQYASYLIRANYEFDIAAGVPAPAWAEVEFTFPDDVTLIDALPRSVIGPEEARSYGVNQHLNFIRRTGAEPGSWPTSALASDIALPAMSPRIDCFGVGGGLVRWRHTGSPTAAIPVGSHTCWFVLLMPPDRESLPVLASGQYWLELDPELDLIPASRRDAFTVQLPVDAATPSPKQVGTVARAGRPRIFIPIPRRRPNTRGTSYGYGSSSKIAE